MQRIALEAIQLRLKTRVDFLASISKSFKLGVAWVLQ